MKKQSYRHTCVHKNLVRLDYLNRFNQLAVSKLRQMFEESKKHQREAQNESRA